MEPATTISIATSILKAIGALRAISGLKKLGPELNQFLNDGLHSYLTDTSEKISQVKTLLYRNSPVEFQKVYLPAYLSLDKSKFYGDRVSSVFMKRSKVTIIGEAGSGKSMLAKHLFFDAIRTGMIPIIVELRNLNAGEEGLIDYVLRISMVKNIAKSPEIFQRLLGSGKFLFMFDGYDEIASSNNVKLVREIIEFVDLNSKNKFLITSRPNAMQVEGLANFTNLKICDLSNAEIRSFIQRQLISTETKNLILQRISDPLMADQKSFLANPMLLTLYILTFGSNSSIPSTRTGFYRRVWDTLYKEHDSITKVGYDREIFSKISQEDFERILSYFSFRSYMKDKFNFDKQYIFEELERFKLNNSKFAFSNNEIIKDLTIAISIWVEDSGSYSFPHRSLQEYFAALYIKGLSIEQKRKAYDKLMELIRARHWIGGTMHLLRLCEEIDHLDFVTIVYEPALRKLNGFIDRSSDESICYSISNFQKWIIIGLKEDMEKLPLAFGGAMWSQNGAIDALVQELRPQLKEITEAAITYLVYLPLSEMNARHFLFNSNNNDILTKEIDEFRGHNLSRKRNIFGLKLSILEGNKDFYAAFFTPEYVEISKKVASFISQELESTEKFKRETHQGEIDSLDF